MTRISDIDYEEGGREVGLVSVTATIQDSTNKISEYIRKMASGDKVLSEYLRQGKNKVEPSRDNKSAQGP